MELPAKVCNATKLYKSENDSLAMFIEDWYDLCRDGVVTSAQLGHDHATWAKQNGELHLNVRAMASRLRARGIEEVRIGRARIRGWRGLRRKGNGLPDLGVDMRTEADTTIQ